MSSSSRSAGTSASPCPYRDVEELLPERGGDGRQGLNDAPALMQADVGIAMGGGTDVAIEAVDESSARAAVTETATE